MYICSIGFEKCQDILYDMGNGNWSKFYHLMLLNYVKRSNFDQSFVCERDFYITGKTEENLTKREHLDRGYLSHYSFFSKF